MIGFFVTHFAEHLNEKALMKSEANLFSKRDSVFAALGRSCLAKAAVHVVTSMSVFFLCQCVR